MTINQYKWNDLPDERRQRFFERSQIDIDRLTEEVRPVVQSVQKEGDSALRRFTRQFDSVDLADLDLAVPQEDIARAQHVLDSDVQDALDYAIENVERFHRPQAEVRMPMVEVRPGLWAGEKSTPIERVGLYVPHGRGSFPSMLYMLAVPARLAGVPHVYVATPPDSDGSVDPAVLYAAQRCGVDSVFRVGGAQAIAAFAYGTETVPAVHKIVGPGSAYVAAAKQLVSHRVNVGLPAGPSESMVLADGNADPWNVALDLSIEAEHGSDSSAVLVSPSSRLVKEVANFLPLIVERAPEPRRTFLLDVFSGYGGLVETESLDQAIDIVNQFAPEHLLIHTAEPYMTVSQIRNAGEILIGPHTAFSLANYAAGANAVLPTGGWAHSYSPVSVRDFVKHSSVVHVTSGAYADMAPKVTTLADYEGFYTHADALRRRQTDVGPSRVS